MKVGMVAIFCEKPVDLNRLRVELEAGAGPVKAIGFVDDLLRVVFVAPVDAHAVESVIDAHDFEPNEEE